MNYIENIGPAGVDYWVRDKEIHERVVKFSHNYATLSDLVSDISNIDNGTYVTISGNVYPGDGGSVQIKVEYTTPTTPYIVVGNRYGRIIFSKSMTIESMGYINGDAAPFINKMIPYVEEIDLAGRNYEIRTPITILQSSRIKKISGGTLTFTGLSLYDTLLTIGKSGVIMDGINFIVSGGYPVLGNNRGVIDCIGGNILITDCTATGFTTAISGSNADCIIKINSEGCTIQDSKFYSVAQSFAVGNNDILIRCVNVSGVYKSYFNSCRFIDSCQGIGGTGELYVTDCSFININDNAIYTFGKTTIDDCYFENCEEAIVASVTLFISDSKFINNTNTAISLNGDSNQTVNIIDCYIYSTRTTADRDLVIRSGHTCGQLNLIGCYLKCQATNPGVGNIDVSSGITLVKCVNTHFETNLNGNNNFIIKGVSGTSAGCSIRMFNSSFTSITRGMLTNVVDTKMFGCVVSEVRHDPGMVFNLDGMQSNINADYGMSKFLGSSDSIPTALTYATGSFVFNHGTTLPNVIGWRFNGTSWNTLTLTTT